MQRNPRYIAGNGPPEDPYERRDYPAPLNEIEFQPSETCPKNFVIFDQTRHKSRVMFHPSLAHKLGSSAPFDAHGAHKARDAGKSACRDNDEEAEDIDALLSSEESEESDAGTSSDGGRREKMKKMVKTLKGIIPGGDRMDTPAVLDEAVKYLKSLKVEVKKLGVKHDD